MRVQTHRIAVNGVEIAYDELGHGTRPLVLVHGFTGSRKDFEPVYPQLAELGRTVVPALRGHCESSHSEKPAGYELDTLAEDLVRLLDVLEIDSCDLLGHSMGGFLVERMVLAHPDRVASLVLMDTAGRAMDWMDESIFEVGGAVARSQGMGRLHEIVRERAAEDPTRTDADRRLEEEWGGERFWSWRRERFSSVDPEAFEPLGLQLAQHPSLLESLGQVRCPTLVMVGEQDGEFVEAARELKAAIPGARLVLIPTAGHQPQLENPDAWLQAIREHLERARGL